MRYPAIVLLTFIVLTSASADDNAPWGQAEATDINYNPQKVVYDVATSPQGLENVLDRASYLSKVYNADPFDASIVLVMHGNEINAFAIENYGKHKELMTRARSLTIGDVIKIRMCEIAAKSHGYDPEDIHGFVELVPMADAEIVRLQAEEGYAYMR